MWEALTVRQFIQLLDIEQNNKLSEGERNLHMLAIVEGNKIEDYKDINYYVLLKKFVDKTSFFNVIPQTKAVDIIEVNGNRYKFCHDITEITAGQFIDINHYGQNIMEMHMAASCFFLPMKGKKIMPYGSVPQQQVAEDLLDARFIDVHGCLLFFYHVLINYTKDTLFSLISDSSRREILTRLYNDGGGFTQLN